MVEPAPSAPFKAPQTRFLFELPIVRSTIQRYFAKRTHSASEIPAGKVDSQSLVANTGHGVAVSGGRIALAPGGQTMADAAGVLRIQY